MKMKIPTLFTLLLLTATLTAQTQSWIRINNIGYLPTDVKVAVLVTKDPNVSVKNFELCDALTDKIVFSSSKIKAYEEWGAFKKAFRLSFSEYQKAGAYYLKVGTTKSPTFRIAPDVYDGTADFLLRYMRQQRCGYNPFLQDSCHMGGGYIVYGDSVSKYRNLAPYPIYGGWHDASDYLQYVATTATATFQMLFAYEQTPSVFGDHFQANGLVGANGIPDILDEAKWGLDWLMLMNPEKNVLFNQVCDDRDHRGMRMPNRDTFSYDIVGKKARPVYRVTGEPQGLGKYKNRTTGVSSTAGKFSAAFAAGARVLTQYYPKFADTLQQKAIDAYAYGKTDTGACQTAPKGAPYFYEEDNWVDDMELAASQLDRLDINVPYYGREAKNYGRSEIITPWIGADTARHYQWYPFVNLGHYYIGKTETVTDFADKNDTEFKNYYKNGIKKLLERSKNNPFKIGTPYIWCSNNYMSAAITQMNLYRKMTQDTSFAELEAAHRDWLLGCNPWGITMIIGLPEWKNTEGVSPNDPHSAFTHVAKHKIDGGLIDGPLYGSIFGKLIGLTLYQPDEYAAFQSKEVVFHDDYGDYSTDEPTMDGTAGLSYYFAAKEFEGKNKKETPPQYFQEKQGAITRLSSSTKDINLVFTGHEFAEGGNSILKTLKKHKIKASFFFTGDFIRNNTDLVKKLKAQGHYIGAHSDKHLLYCDWAKRDSLLVTKQQFLTDLKENYTELSHLGIGKNDASVFLSPYEWYNDSIAIWAKNAGLTLINFTPGTSSNADYTTPDMKNYKSSQEIYEKILAYEKTDKRGLNGFILLLHIGVGDKRTDKFYNRLSSLIGELKKRGYDFDRF
jgi:endoglucanase